jgi:hypothetical protein
MPVPTNQLTTYQGQPGISDLICVTCGGELQGFRPWQGRGVGQLQLATKGERALAKDPLPKACISLGYTPKWLRL